jgi:hypothetical protein
MAKPILISDTTGEIVTGSIYLPRSKSVAIGAPVQGVALAVLKEELSTFFGDRFAVSEFEEADKPASRRKPEPVAADGLPN